MAPETRPETHPRICEHESCGCPTSHPASAYCSAYCANVDHHEEGADACACGHPSCVASQRVARADEDVAAAIGQDPGADDGSR